MLGKRMLLLAAVVVLGASGSVYAQGPAAYAEIDSTTGQPVGYYSPRLGGRFKVTDFELPQYGAFRAIRITGLDGNSPLRQIGLRPGDVITRLDGTRTDNLAELDRHAYSTAVRFIRSGQQHAQTLEVYIPVTTNYPPLVETP